MAKRARVIPSNPNPEVPPPTNLDKPVGNFETGSLDDDDPLDADPSDQLSKPPTFLDPAAALDPIITALTAEDSKSNVAQMAGNVVQGVVNSLQTNATGAGVHPSALNIALDVLKTVFPLLTII